MAPLDRYLYMRNHRVRYWDEGSGSRTVLFVHGLASNVHYWYKTIPVLREHYRVLAFDLLGFGASSKPKVRYDHHFLIQCVKDFLEIMQINSCVLVGHSMGGGICSEFAVTYPNLVEKLVLVSSVGFCRYLPLAYCLVTLPILGELLARPYSLKTAGKFLRNFVYEKRQITDEFVYEIHRHHQSPDFFRTFLSVIRNHVNLFGIKNFVLELAVAHSIFLKAPTLIVWGEEDRLLPLKNAYRAKELIPHAELHIFKQCGHIPQLEHPEQFNRILMDFIDHTD